MFRPLGSGPGRVVDPDDNRISLTINDEARSDEMTADKTRLYTAFSDYIEANPEYEPFRFARSPAPTGAWMSFTRTPATQLAIRWLWQDLEALGFLEGPASPDI